MSQGRRFLRSPLGLAAAICGLLATVSAARAQTNNLCDEPGEYPDVIVGDIPGKARLGTLDGITAFSMAVTECNPGTCWANFFASTAEHPGTTQNMFRLEAGRFEQIGQSWVFHAFVALSSTHCSSQCIGAEGSHLGVNCSNPEAANYESTQSRLGPKSEVNPFTGVFPFPATGMSSGGSVIHKRLQVHNDDLDPALHPGARYWVEVQLVTRDDAAGGNLNNNVSYRPINVTGTQTFDIALTGSTAQAKAAIEAWKSMDPDVTIAAASPADDGRFIVGSRVTTTASGYHYEYAVQNLNSYRAAATFTVPLPAGATVTNIGFHDVDYHSGELISGTDWAATITDDAIVWSTEPYAVNPNANALRWGTLYNFRFDSPVPPGDDQVVLGMFRPGVLGDVSVSAAAPCDGSDLDGDSHRTTCDCDDGNGQTWRVPGEVASLVVVEDGLNGTLLSWSPPENPGAATVAYDVLRSSDPSDFITTMRCLPGADPTSPARSDTENPSSGVLFAYLVRARNSCPEGTGSLGTSSNGTLRQGGSCP